MNKKHFVALLFLGISTTLNTVVGAATIKQALAAPKEASTSNMVMSNEEDDAGVPTTAPAHNAKHNLA